MSKFINQNSFFLFIVLLPFLFIPNFFSVNFFFINKDFPFFLNSYPIKPFYWDIYSNSNNGYPIDIFYYFQNLFMYIFSLASNNLILANIINKLALIIPLLTNYYILFKICHKYDSSKKYLLILLIISLPLFNNYQLFFNLGLMGILLFFYSYLNNLFIKNYNYFLINLILSIQLTLLYPRFLIPYFIITIAYIFKSKINLKTDFKKIFNTILIFFILNFFSIFTVIHKIFFTSGNLYNPSISSMKSVNHYNFIDFFDTFAFIHLNSLSLVIYFLIIVFLIFYNFLNIENFYEKIKNVFIIILIKFLLFYYYKYSNHFVLINNPHIYFTISDIFIILYLLKFNFNYKKIFSIVILICLYLSFFLSVFLFHKNFLYINSDYFLIKEKLISNNLHNEKMNIVASSTSKINNSDDQLNLFLLSRTFHKANLFEFDQHSNLCNLSIISWSEIYNYKYIFIDENEIDLEFFLKCFSDNLSIKFSFNNFHIYKIKDYH
jgi:hypothetical protein